MRPPTGGDSSGLAVRRLGRRRPRVNDPLTAVHLQLRGWRRSFKHFHRRRKNENRRGTPFHLPQRALAITRRSNTSFDATSYRRRDADVCGCWRWWRRYGVGWRCSCLNLAVMISDTCRVVFDPTRYGHAPTGSLFVAVVVILYYLTRLFRWLADWSWYNRREPDSF